MLMEQSLMHSLRSGTRKGFSLSSLLFNAVLAFCLRTKKGEEYEQEQT